LLLLLQRKKKKKCEKEREREIEREREREIEREREREREEDPVSASRPPLAQFVFVCARPFRARGRGRQLGRPSVRQCKQDVGEASRQWVGQVF
jgi:hypothetical protein